VRRLQRVRKFGHLVVFFREGQHRTYRYSEASRGRIDTLVGKLAHEKKCLVMNGSSGDNFDIRL
jgi:hypothetical protein